MFPHLYEHDMDDLKDFRDRCLSAEDKDIKDIGKMMTRVIDWITAESISVSNMVKLSAVRTDKNEVTVYSLDMLTEGKSDNVLGALQGCVDNMELIAHDLDNADDEDMEDTIGYKDHVQTWIREFPRTK
jgi:hypothetical protein